MPLPEKGPEQQPRIPEQSVTPARTPGKRFELTARPTDEIEERNQEYRKLMWRIFGYDDPFDWKTPWEEEFEL